jgi:beta-glucanase (GH16 family)
MNKIKWMGYEWLTQQQWGEFQNDNWFDEEAVELEHPGWVDTLSLKNRYKPKQFPNTSNPIPISTGLVSCTTHFSYGKFEIKAKLPSGPYTWPAFWMYAFESWPPEIDVFEGYTNRKGSYFNWSLRSLIGKFWRVDTNVYLGEKPIEYNLGGKSHWLGWKSPDKVFNKYGVIWSEKEIVFLFNDKPVRKITDEKYLSQFKGKTMNVIINNGSQKEYLDTDMPETELIVKYFKYEKL